MRIICKSCAYYMRIICESYVYNMSIICTLYVNVDVIHIYKLKCNNYICIHNMTYGALGVPFYSHIIYTLLAYDMHMIRIRSAYGLHGIMCK